MKAYVVGAHFELPRQAAIHVSTNNMVYRLIGAIQISTHNISFYEENQKKILHNNKIIL